MFIPTFLTTYYWLGILDIDEEIPILFSYFLLFLYLFKAPQKGLVSTIVNMTTLFLHFGEKTLTGIYLK
jgi:hypothetical protein